MGMYVDNHDAARVPVSSKEREKRKGKYPYYGASGVIDQIDGYTHQGEYLLLGEDGANLLARSKPIAFLAKGKFWVNNHAHVLKCRGEAPNAYLAYYLNRIDLTPYVTGTAQPKLSQAKMNKIPIPVAPLDQQKCIVAEIEKQFSRLDEAVANLKRYKASVLKAAVEGKLTEDWHKQHPNVEPASKLLERILADRRGKWTDKGKYKEPSALEVIDFPSLPKGWTWASLDQLSWDSSYGTSVKCSYNNSGPAVFRIPNIASGKLDLRDLKFAPDSYEVGRGDKLSAGDLLIIRTNGSRNLIGRSAVVRQPLPSASAFASYLIRFRLAQQLEIIKWLSAIWDAEHFRVWIEKRASTSAGQHNISMSVLARLPVPLPPLAEQDQVVSEVERRLSVIEELEAAVEANLTRADHLRQAILQRAFSGRLLSEKGHAGFSDSHMPLLAAESVSPYGVRS